MDWYWWVLIILGIIGLGAIKFVVGGKYLAKKKKEREEREKIKERED